MGMLDISDVTCSAILIGLLASLPDNLCVARSLSLAHHNAGYEHQPSPITIYQGMTLGKAVSEDTVLLVSDSKTQTKSAVCFDNPQLPDLSEAEKTRLISLLTEYCDIFGSAEGPSGYTSVVKHTIPTTRITDSAANEASS